MKKPIKIKVFSYPTKASIFIPSINIKIRAYGDYEYYVVRNIKTNKLTIVMEVLECDGGDYLSYFFMRSIHHYTEEEFDKKYIKIQRITFDE